MQMNYLPQTATSSQTDTINIVLVGSINSGKYIKQIIIVQVQKIARGNPYQIVL